MTQEKPKIEEISYKVIGQVLHTKIGLSRGGSLAASMLTFNLNRRSSNPSKVYRSLLSSFSQNQE